MLANWLNPPEADQLFTILNELGLSFLFRLRRTRSSRFGRHFFLFTKNFDCRIRADESTHGTAGAACSELVETIGVSCSLDLARDRFSGKVAAFVGFFGDGDATLRAYRYAQAAALATLDIDNYPAGHFSYRFFYRRVRRTRGDNIISKW